MPVKAPYAQGLVRKAANADPELVFLGLHVIPLGKSDNGIIACTDESKIGKVSSAADMEVATGKAMQVECRFCLVASV